MAIGAVLVHFGDHDCVSWTAWHRCRGLWELGQYSFRATYQDAEGMEFATVGKEGNGMGVVWIVFAVEWPVFLTLAWYLEQVISSATGIRKHWLFPIRCGLLLRWPPPPVQAYFSPPAS
jgi:hypothetical protein